jgi:hypothetical protein
MDRHHAGEAWKLRAQRSQTENHPDCLEHVGKKWGFKLVVIVLKYVINQPYFDGFVAAIAKFWDETNHFRRFFSGGDSGDFL